MLDVYCYACDDARVDPDIAKHLSTFGIEVASQKKTEKSMTELVRLVIASAAWLRLTLSVHAATTASRAEPHVRLCHDGRRWQGARAPGWPGLDRSQEPRQQARLDPVPAVVAPSR